MAPGSSATRKLARTGFWVRRTIKAPLRPETAKVIFHDILAKNGGRRGVVTLASKFGALPELSEIGRMRRFGDPLKPFGTSRTIALGRVAIAWVTVKGWICPSEFS